ncbi:hypothetical protein DSO57_1012746 [Entomophthora muscae]|uniref:Uncharacterized protein n=1 Tax=Entomophthora muscae TaxID=34485 RepID=A0ACC2SV89_9FUNG|nr:hypothetical protein DSO57_1012746 [Entomophthora muscae]
MYVCILLLRVPNCCLLVLVNTEDGVDSDEDVDDLDFSYPHLPFLPPVSRQSHRLARNKNEVEASLAALYEAELYGESRGFSRQMIRTAIAYLGPRCTLTSLVDYILLHLAPSDAESIPMTYRDTLLHQELPDEKLLPLVCTPLPVELPPVLEEMVVLRKESPLSEVSPELLPEDLEVRPLSPISDDDYTLDPDITYKYSLACHDCEIYSQILKQLANTSLDATYSPGIRYRLQKAERRTKQYTSALYFNAKEAKYHAKTLQATTLERSYHLKQAISPTLDKELKQARMAAHQPLQQKVYVKSEPKAPIPESDDEEPPFALDSLFDDAEPSSATLKPEPGKKIQKSSVSLVVPSGWTGQTPKSLLLGFCKAKKADIKITADQTTSVAKAVVTMRTTVAAPTTHTFLSSQPPTPSPGQPQTKAECENLVATVALFKLDWLSNVSVLPPPFQDIFTAWKLEEKMGKDLDAHKELLERYDFLSATLTPPEGPARDKALEPSPDEIETKAAPLPTQKAYWSQKGRDLNKTFLARTQSQGYCSLLAQRKELPMYGFRSQLLESLANPGQVVLVVGETGCGKTTQVPQFLVEQAAASNKPCRVVCTQPRRISAVSVAQRVSQELGDNAVGTPGSLVGYQIRLASRASPSNLLIFCTLGVLLRRLEKDPDFKDLTHLVIDEIQERSLDSDFLLVLVRRITMLNTHLRVVLMSATVDANAFSAYFGNCPVLHVPGRTFPVQVHYLETVLKDTGYVLESGSYYARRESHSLPARRLRTNHAFDPPVSADPVKSTLSLMREDIINNELIIRLLHHISDSAVLPEGAILIFLPGVPEIKLLHSHLAADSVLGDGKRFMILQAHSGVPPDQQTAIFASVGAPLRKVVLATNVAETGITIPDVTIVIDTGRMKQIQRDRKLQVSQLVAVDVAQANAKQRTGRAGRVCPGVCFRLFTKERFDKMLPYQTPEMARLPLEELCLRIKVLGLADVHSFLAQTIHPPPTEAVSSSIALLQEVGALDASQELTPLGIHLSRLPVSVHIGKVMIYGALFCCIDPALTFAAVMSYKSPFISQMHPKFSTCRCDFLSLYSAYCQWREAMVSGMKQGISFCITNGLSQDILLEIEEMKKQYIGLLIDAGFVTFANDPPPRRLHRDLCNTPQSFNANSQTDAVVKCVLVAGLYPKVLMYDPHTHTLAKPPLLIKPTKLGLSARLKNALSRPQTNLPQASPSLNSIHHEVFSMPASQVPHQRMPTPNQRYAVYYSLMKGKRNLSAEALSFITPLPILLFARDLVVVHDAKLAIADSALYIRCPSRTASAVMQLRLELGRLLELLVATPNSGLDFYDTEEHEARRGRLLSLLTEILSAEE